MFLQKYRNIMLEKYCNTYCVEEKFCNTYCIGKLLQHFAILFDSLLPARGYERNVINGIQG